MTIYVIAFAFIVLDFITGLVKALATTSFTSTKMREGLFHKVAFKGGDNGLNVSEDLCRTLNKGLFIYKMW